MAVIEVIKERLHRDGTSQRHVAIESGINEKVLSRSLTGKRTLTGDELVAICRALHMDIADFN